MRRSRSPAPGTSGAHVLEHEGGTIAIRVRRHRRARRVTLRIDPRRDCAVLTLPMRTPLAEGLRFAREKAEWLAARLAALPPVTPFAEGAVIPFGGQEVRIRHFPLAGQAPVLAADGLYVPGPAAGLASCVAGWLKSEAHAALTAASAAKAKLLERPLPPIRLGDPSTRWGSCSAAGRLSFSWRLVMAPPMALDYVVAHEIAHLVHLDHGPRFHALLSRLAEREAEGRAWLARHGAGLLRYG